jgi:hypothetical protein
VKSFISFQPDIILNSRQTLIPVASFKTFFPFKLMLLQNKLKCLSMTKNV